MRVSTQPAKNICRSISVRIVFTIQPSEALCSGPFISSQSTGSHWYSPSCSSINFSIFDRIGINKKKITTCIIEKPKTSKTKSKTPKMKTLHENEVLKICNLSPDVCITSGNNGFRFEAQREKAIVAATARAY